MGIAEEAVAKIERRTIPGETPEQYQLRQKDRIRELVDQESGFLAYNLLDMANPGGEKAVNEATYEMYRAMEALRQSLLAERAPQAAPAEAADTGARVAR